MNRRKFLITTASALSFLLATGCTKAVEQPKKDGASDSSHDRENGYWTCTMHPQVHKVEPGKCPICGMPLVHVDKKAHLEPKSQESNGVEPTDAQLKNTNISKFTVHKKDFVITLSLSGRVVSPREIAFQVYESDLSIVKRGVEISGVTSTDPEKVLKGKISGIDNLVDPTSRTVRANALLNTAISNFVAETSFYGQVQNSLKNQVAVPEEAVLHAGKRDLVYIFTQDGKLEPREVKLGLKSKGEYQILSGLNEGDVISAGANFLIDSEAKIRGGTQ
jgi:multidrug efflux pump subunit AcrA (membrane-fusion protein)